MTTTVKLKNSVITTNAPSSLQQGEVAINITDRKVWVGNAATTPVQLLGDGAQGNFTTLNVTGVATFFSPATFAAGTVSAPSITTIGDTNTGIYFPSADTIAFTEGGAESMRIDSLGNVGINTNTPSAYPSKLVVANSSITAGLNSTTGSTLLRGLYTAGALSVWGTEHANGGPVVAYACSPSTSAAGSYVSEVDFSSGRSAFVLQGSNFIWNAGDGQTVAVGSPVITTERMRLNASGNLGIGTNNPTSKLFVEGSSIQARLGSTGIQIFGDGGAGYVNSVGAFPLILQTNSTERVRLTNAGDLGIGTNNPTVRLEFSSTSAASYARSFWNANNTDAGEVVRGGYLISTKNFAGTPANWGMNGFTNGLNVDFSAGLNFTTVAGSTTLERMRITSLGNVGIGTTQPNHLLIVASGNEAGNTLIGTYNTNAGPTALQFLLYHNSSNVVLGNFRSGSLTFTTNNVAQANITSAGLFQFNSGYGSVATAYGCRAWARYTGSRTNPIQGSGNVSSVADAGVGYTIINFAVGMPDAGFTLVGAAKRNDDPSAGGNNVTFAPYAFSVGSVRVITIEANLGVGIDVDVVTAAVFR